MVTVVGSSLGCRFMAGMVLAEEFRWLMPSR